MGINSMTFTAAEKLQIAMLCDLAKPEKEKELDFEFIREAVSYNDLWALHWQYPTPEQVKFVCDVLDMWERLEENFESLDGAEKARVQKESYSSTPPPPFRGLRWKQRNP
jgi:hypothetical protein